MNRWILALLSLACAPLEPIESDGTCGNRILEPGAGEDCDGTPPGGLECGGCRFTCVSVPCPAGFVCGGDQVCRVPKGTFVSVPLGFSEPPRNALAADLDHDTYQDLVLLTGRDVQVHYGEPAGGLGEVRSFEIDNPFNKLQSGDFDHDLLEDVVIEQSGGPIFLRGRSDRVLEQVARPAFARASDPLQSVVLAPQVRAVSVAVERFTGLRRAVLLVKRDTDVSLELPFDFLVDAPLPLALGRGALPQEIAVADAVTSPDSILIDELALGLEQTRSIVVFNIDCSDVCEPVILAEIETTEPILGGTYFTDVNGDGTQDLLVHVVGGFEVAFGDAQTGFCADPACTERDRTSRVRVRAGMGELIGAPLFVGEYGYGPVTDFVFSETIDFESRALAVGATLAPSLEGGFDLFVAEQVIAIGFDPWTQVESGDFNRDGRTDLAAVRSRGTALDVLLGTGSPLFNPFTVQFEAPLARIAVGDFDGDLFDDVAAYEPNSGLYLVSGTPQGPGVPSFLIQSRGVVDLVAADSLSTTGPDLIRDLLVISEATETSVPTYAVTLLSGSSGGQMLAPLSFVVDGMTQQQVVVETVVGKFSADDFGDIIIATSTGGDGMSSARIALWAVPGDAQNSNVPTPVVLSNCGLHPLCFKAKPPAVANFDGDPEDESLVLSRCPADDTLWIIDVDVASAGGTCWRVESLENEIQAPADLVPIDLDFDGRAEIVVYETSVTKVAQSRDGIEWRVDPIQWPEVDPPKQLTVLGDGSTDVSLAFVATSSSGETHVYAGSLEGTVLTGVPIAVYPFVVGFKEPVPADFEEPSGFNLDDRSGLLQIDLRGDNIPDLVLLGSQLLVQEECASNDSSCTRPEVGP